MNYRIAKEKDAEQIALVLKECYNIDTIDESIEVFKNETNKNHFYIVAEENNKIIGIVTLIIHGLYKHGLAELDRIAVLPEGRGKGIAVELFNQLVKHSKRKYEEKGYTLRKLYLLTHHDNERAHSFYKKVGFKYETTLKNHYYNKKDEYVFSMFFSK